MKAFSGHQFTAYRWLAIGLLVFMLHFLSMNRDEHFQKQIRLQPQLTLDPFSCTHFSIGVRQQDYDFLFSDRPKSLFAYQNAEFALNRLPKKYRAEFRIRGTHAWNWDYLKPSFRLQMKGQTLLFGHKSLDFINPDDASMLANLLADNIASDLGLPSPRTRLCTVTLNQDYKGLYHLAEPINLTTLKLQNFSGVSILEGNARNSKMWLNASLWELETNSDFEELRTNLERMLNLVKTPVAHENLLQLTSIIDFSFTARWSALMSAIASIHTNDFLGNLLIFDHKTGKFFPAIADSTGFAVITAMAGQHEEIDVRVPPYEFLTPLFNALFRIPEFQFLRNRELYQLLNGPLAPENLERLTSRYLEVLRPRYYNEPYAAALINIPKVLFSRKVPVAPETQLADASRLLDFMKRRRIFLLDLLDRCELDIFSTGENQRVNQSNYKIFHLIVNGHSPALIDLRSFAGKMLADRDFDGNLEADSAFLARSLLLHPGLREFQGDYPHWLLLERRFCGFVLEPERQIYIIGIEESMAEAIAVHLQNSTTNAVTGKPAKVQFLTSSPLSSAQPAKACIHPWRTN